MAKVTLTSGGGGDPTSRNLVATKVGDQVQYYRNSIQHLDTDPRIKSGEFKRVQQDLKATTLIWKDRPECFKDHFRRAYKDYTYGYKANKTLTKRLTGYKLYHQLMLDSFSRNKGSFYDPPCFCIEPVDGVGQQIHSYGHLDMQSGVRTIYKFKETRQLQIYSGCAFSKINPFKSAAFYQPPLLNHIFLAVPWAYPRYQSVGFHAVDWSFWRSPVMWAPLVVNDNPDDHEVGQHMWDCCYFTWHPGGDCQCDSGGNPYKCINGNYVGLAKPESMCGRDEIEIKMKYNQYALGIEVKGTDEPPLKHFHFAGGYLGPVGIGDGNPVKYGASLSLFPPEKNNMDGLTPWKQSEPCPHGEVDCNSPVGEKVQGSLYGYRESGFKEWCDEPTARIYYFNLDKKRIANAAKRNPEFKVIMNDVVYDGRGFQNWCPWGGLAVFVGTPEGDWVRTYRGNWNTCCSPGKMIYCFDNNMAHAIYDKVAVLVQNTTAWPCCTKSKVSGLFILDRYPIDD